MIIKITFAIQCASIAMALIIAHEYHDAKTANAAKLAAARGFLRNTERIRAAAVSLTSTECVSGVSYDAFGRRFSGVPARSPCRLDLRGGSRSCVSRLRHRGSGRS